MIEAISSLRGGSSSEIEGEKYSEFCQSTEKKKKIVKFVDWLQKKKKKKFVDCSEEKNCEIQ